MRFRTLICIGAVVAIASPLAAQAPEKIDADLNAKLRVEGTDHSRIMWIEHNLTDAYGPRPIGSPNHVAAANWAVKTMTSWGMKNAHLEPFTWNGVGWLPGEASGFMLTPVKANLKFEAQPWSPSTKGTVTGEVVALIPPDNPTDAELTSYLISMAPKVKGGIVMFGPPASVPVDFNPRPKRNDDASTKASYQPRDSAAAAAAGGGRGAGAGAGGGRGGGAGRGGAAAAPLAAGQLSSQQVTQRITAFLRDNMPALRLTGQEAGRIPGVIVAQNGAGQIYDDVTPQPPVAKLRTDDYGRIYRLIQDGTPVKVEFNIQNTFYPEGKTSYVTVGEIPGTDKADEVVMLGGHLDSWTSATGATDNAIGCAIMMEAARMIEALGLKPRRTIRVALWSGEEEGLLGSFAYVKNHFGSAEAPTKEFDKLDAYWNIDDGTGRVRGASIFGPPAAATILAQYIKPFEDWGMYGATASTARVEGGSDNGAFAVAGLPGIGARQDPIEYNSTTWHTDLDTYERIVPEDVMHNAVLTAAVMMGLANRDEMLPKFTTATMPAVPPARGGGGGGGGGGGAGRGNAPNAASHIYTTKKDKPLVMAAGTLTGGGGRGAPAPAAAGAAAAPATTAAIGTKPKHGTVLLTATGGFTYTPTAAYVGTDSFTYTLKRGTEASAEATVTIVVK